MNLELTDQKFRLSTVLLWFEWLESIDICYFPAADTNLNPSKHFWNMPSQYKFYTSIMAS